MPHGPIRWILGGKLNSIVDVCVTAVRDHSPNVLLIDCEHCGLVEAIRAQIPEVPPEAIVVLRMHGHCDAYRSRTPLDLHVDVNVRGIRWIDREIVVNPRWCYVAGGHTERASDQCNQAKLDGDQWLLLGVGSVRTKDAVRAPLVGMR